MQIMRSALLCSLVALALAPTGALAAPDRTATLSAAAGSFAWDGAQATGNNTARDPQACSKDVETYCDLTLVKVEAADGVVGELKVDIGEYFGPQCTPADGQNAPCDFSLWLYQSDATGKVGKNIANSVNDSGEPETVMTKKATAGFYMIVVYYYTVVQSSFKGTMTLSNLTAAPVEGGVETPAAPAPAAPGGLPTTGDFTAMIALAGKATVKTGLPTRVTCTVVCKGRVVAEISAATARKLGLGRKKMIIGTVAVAVDKPEGTTVVLKLSKKAAAKLKKARSAKVVLRALMTDGSGARSARASRMLTLKR